MQWPKPSDDDDDDDRTWLANLLCKRKYGISLLSGNGAAAIEIVLRRKKKRRRRKRTKEEGGRCQSQSWCSSSLELLELVNRINCIILCLVIVVVAVCCCLLLFVVLSVLRICCQIAFVGASFVMASMDSLAPNETICCPALPEGKRCELTSSPSPCPCSSSLLSTCRSCCCRPAMSQVLNPSLINYRCQQLSFSIESCSQLAISTQSSHCKRNFIQMQEVTRSTWRMRNVGGEGKGNGKK